MKKSNSLVWRSFEFVVTAITYKGDFFISAALVTHINRVYVRSAFQHIPDWYEDSLLKHYEGTYFPEHMENAGKASYVERNQEMINHSKFCVVYYDENYLPPRCKNSRRDLFDYQPKSGTAVAYDYAVKKKKCSHITSATYSHEHITRYKKISFAWPTYLDTAM